MRNKEIRIKSNPATFLFAIYFLLSVILIIFINAPLMYAQSYPKRSEKELLERCFTQLTGFRLGSSSPLWKRLSSEGASSICLSLLKSVTLDSNGLLASPDNTLNRAILKQFIDFHRSWFEQQWAYLSTFPDSHTGGVDIYDPQEAALMLTRNLILNEPYKNILSGFSTAVALRDDSKLLPRLPAEAAGFPRLSRYTTHKNEGPIVNSNTISYTTELELTPTNLQTLPTPLIQLGEPVGIKLVDYNASPLLPIIWTNIFTPNASYVTPGISTPQPFLANKGGGVLGSIPYIMLNFGHGFEYKSDGAAKLPRRYISTVFKELLCRTGPYVRSTDVAPWQSNLEASPPFRKFSACLRCHTTLDQSALTLRNLRLGSTANAFGNIVDFRVPVVLANYDIDSSKTPSEFWPAVGEPEFFKTKPEGRLYFRSITGELIDQHVNNLESLGQALANTPDFYTCAAKKYFEFFTHKKVELFDPYDPSNQLLVSSMSKDDQNYKAFVIALGKELQSTGSLKNLIKRILESDFYAQH